MITHTSLGHHPFSRARKLKKLIAQGTIQWAGNRNLKIYGTLCCSSGKKMKVKNRVFFSSEAEALRAGYRPCGHCLREPFFLWLNRNKASLK